eukprot:gene840-9089_t
MNKPRPTHFLSLRVKNKKIWEKIDEFQQNMITYDSNFEYCRIPSHDSHITLLVLQLKEEKDIEKAIKALNSTNKILQTLEKVNFSGIDTFSERVIFTKVKDSKNIIEFMENVHKIFLEHKVPNIQFNGTPHLTIFKTSKGPNNLFEYNKFPIESFKDQLDFNFGDFTFDSIELNKMKKKGDYYVSEKIIKF